MSFLVPFAIIFGMVFMLAVIFLGVWFLVLAKKALGQLKYKNYLLEKLNQSLKKNEKKQKKQTK